MVAEFDRYLRQRAWRQHGTVVIDVCLSKNRLPLNPFNHDFPYSVAIYGYTRFQTDHVDSSIVNCCEWFLV